MRSFTGREQGTDGNPCAAMGEFNSGVMGRREGRANGTSRLQDERAAALLRVWRCTEGRRGRAAVGHPPALSSQGGHAGRSFFWGGARAPTGGTLEVLPVAGVGGSRSGDGRRVGTCSVAGNQRHHSGAWAAPQGGMLAAARGHVDRVRWPRCFQVPTGKAHHTGGCRAAFARWMAAGAV
jgi:hypothetical protein